MLFRSMVKDNVKLSNGSLELVVTGGAGTGDTVKSSEVSTVANDIRFGSITTSAKVSNVAGVCHGQSYIPRSLINDSNSAVCRVFLLPG